jgi:hypothetical protein
MMTGEKLPHKCLIIDEMQSLLATKGLSQDVDNDQRRIVQGLVNRILNFYRKANVTIVLIGVVSQSTALNLNFNAIPTKLAGYLFSVPTSKAFLDESPIANNRHLRQGRLVLADPDFNGGKPGVIQLPLSTLEEYKKFRLKW